MKDTSCNRCGMMHFGSVRCPYLDQAQCNNCGGVITAEEGNNYQVHPNRKFDFFGFPYHPGCEFKEKTTMRPHQQRVVDEKTELVTKIDKLKAFIMESLIFKTLPADEQKRLNRQYDAMVEYANILKARIDEFPNKGIDSRLFKGDNLKWLGLKKHCNANRKSFKRQRS